MKRKEATKFRKTALWKVPVNGYTKEELWRTIFLVTGVLHVTDGLTKEQAIQVCRHPKASTFELTLCTGLLNAYKAGTEKQYRQRWFMTGTRLLRMSLKQSL